MTRAIPVGQLQCQSYTSGEVAMSELHQWGSYNVKSYTSGAQCQELHQWGSCNDKSYTSGAQELHQWGSNSKSYTSGAVAMARATPVGQLQ